ncbi:bifunctional 4-hydroxy-2-oxoglutarate aldolase/2-dehydro-3-deoxy-phosphogluconate aldolase [Anaerobacillus sp. CMMVII]|uniref:bifunctional 4-hydroxy-2-oxoglutarate aldolase/2-dehydro-3-deoxy-phosphogluconate aldolase n=1 Tax=Anaerobacillus sp. CMMVII TaxID=2755588 RepID=UPI0021B6F0A8|nr:bifunctional 4-hydroxy-2-oxoglutarate aldolase/2-dehydro-3-deoxy-phosphogluconate aldolase [Anaerobacillus sp. CMMVII]MCT8139258.1 bifunctional 4-hydroxy-2-oxoglutarate aldolase/2-dehydro-3-deoxy-phosphogluconate aldolase [Anaerobacillus sp. CMMVII]
MIKQAVLREFEALGVIAVLRKVPYDHFLPLAETLVKAGIHLLEITVDSDQGIKMIEDAVKHFKEEAVIGAGTVVSGIATREVIRAGASFVFSPIFSKEVVEVARDHKTLVAPGVMTPTEIYHAIEAGADAVKIFPAATLGPSFIKDVQGPLGKIPIITTGGVSVDNACEYIRAGAIAVGVGGSLVDLAAMHEKKYDVIYDRAIRIVEKVQSSK